IRLPSRSFLAFLPDDELLAPPLNDEVFKCMPILLTLSSQSSGTFSILSASRAIGRISFSANQWVISLICCCCSDNSKLIMCQSPLLLRQSDGHHSAPINHSPCRKASLEPGHPASIFLPGNPGQNHVPQAAVQLSPSHNAVNDEHGALPAMTDAPPQAPDYPFLLQLPAQDDSQFVFLKPSMPHGTIHPGMQQSHDQMPFALPYIQWHNQVLLPLGQFLLQPAIYGFGFALHEVYHLRPPLPPAHAWLEPLLFQMKAGRDLMLAAPNDNHPVESSSQRSYQARE